MLVVQKNTTVVWAFVYKMPQMEKTMEETNEKTREKGDSIADSRQKKVGGWPVKKRKSSTTTTKILETINVEGRERARERGLEWEQKNDQAVEDLFY